MPRFVPLRAYLSEASVAGTDKLSRALDDLMNAFGLAISDEFPAIYGSWYKKWFAKTKEDATKPEVAERLAKVERAIEMQGLNKPQAEIDVAQSTALNNLMSAMKDVPHAALQIGSILLVKTEIDGKSMVRAKTLSQKEIIYVENNPDLLSTPQDLLDNLAKISRSSGSGIERTIDDRLSSEATGLHDPHRGTSLFSRRSKSADLGKNVESGSEDSPSRLQLGAPRKD